jgi:hypothetical protein
MITSGMLRLGSPPPSVVILSDEALTISEQPNRLLASDPGQIARNTDVDPHMMPLSSRMTAVSYPECRRPTRLADTEASHQP